MKYHLLGGVWELTMACNMRCQHCGSICTTKQDDELTTEEALDLCDQLADLGMRFITLSGGELTTRDDWDIIGKRLTDNGIRTSMITNGWLLDDNLLQRAKDAGFVTIAISVDGLQKTHDQIRRPGSYERDMAIFKKIRAMGINACAVTTVHEGNIAELEGLYQELLNADVNVWQIQIALPMGNFSHHKELYLKKSRMSELIDFCYEKKDGSINICPADCVGYFTEKESLLSEAVYLQKFNWDGCHAGKTALGILCNGDITGCTSIRGEEFIEGNIRNTPLREIWEREGAFSWSRNLKKQDLKGFCHDCIYGEQCLGGCTNSRYTYGGSIYNENAYCAFHYDMAEFREGIDACSDVAELKEFASSCAGDGHYQQAILATKKLISLEPDNLVFKDMFAFLHFQIHDYTACKAINKEILKIDQTYNHALKGLGLATYRLGDQEAGIQLIRHSLEHGDVENYKDLYQVLLECGRDEAAKQVQEEALERFSINISK